MIRRFFELLEAIAIGWEPDPADEVLLHFANGQTFTRRNAREAVLVLASVGGGKTTLLRTIQRAYLRDGMGGLVLVVKPSQIADFEALAKQESREREMIVLGRPGVVFNPLEVETSSVEAAALVCEIAQAINGQTSASDNEAFWREQLGILLRNLFTLCRIAYGGQDFLLAAELFSGRAKSLAELDDPNWQTSSRLAAALTLARTTPSPEAHLAVEYFTREFPTCGDRLQGSLAATAAGVLDYFCREPLRYLFTGKSSFSMDDLLDRGRICVVGLPVLESNAGRAANALMQYCFLRTATKRARKRHSFLISDECQETVSRHLMQQLALIREFQICSVFASQNLAVLDDRLGEVRREAFCGLQALRIFGPQGHAATRQWASEQMCKLQVEVETESLSRSKTFTSRTVTRGTSTHKHWDYRVPPSLLASLSLGETLCLRGGKVWRAKWHRDEPGRAGTVEIPFSL